MNAVKLFLLVPIIFFSSSFQGLSGEAQKSEAWNPLLVVVIMVKNEQDSIVPTLKPFVDGGVDAFYVFDTGSTDRTVEVATEYLQECNVRFVIGQEPFVDFATSRNRGLDLALEAFPNAVFMCMPDAEWYIRNAHDLLKFCAEHIHDIQPAYLIRIASADIDFYTPRLIRCNAGMRFAGEVHEVLDYCARVQVPKHVMFDLSPSHYGAEKSRKRWERDLKIFERKFIEDPLGTRNLFYYGQTLWCLDKLHEAYTIYKIRAQLVGWDEEDFLSWYRLARITEQLAKIDPKYTWSEAMEYYLKAFTMRPRRAEPIIRIALHYLEEDNHAVGYIFALRAGKVPYPKDDILMVEKDLYEFLRWEILSRCAWYVDEDEEGFAAACKAKKARPDLAHIQRNAQLYFDRVCLPGVA